ncbi:hypothetical protein DDB_G0285155 [Dictyostelium discoideum AX4]|uniref:Uncharacterized protein n=1 Tax=Dictyostelium discoideum TaxID=44689 RepID=Q54NN3_DICDI|nr:hypothetical protein DDB_G0285155 [Dictyostelium discoideum AX4]EAL64890.1 hypothetical protein DDB_G0285155 [Dictyostelium discoideum AX4]|eukprot:XP_639883.1 hypothetical protein DDB_G0285155 [Dictyostelium discoideum AX4]
MEKQLFFKVFNNKYISSLIFSFISTSSFMGGKFKYDEITSVQWMIDNKHYSLLKDKVKIGKENLSFYPVSNEIYFPLQYPHDINRFFGNCENNKNKNKNKNELKKNEEIKFDPKKSDFLFSIFSIPDIKKKKKIKKIKTTREEEEDEEEEESIEIISLHNDIEFYYYLFKNYYSSFFKFMNIKLLVEKLISYDNYIALDLLYMEYKLIEPTLTMFISSVRLNSFKMANYIYNQLGCPEMDNQILWNSIINKENRSIDIDKKLQYLVFKTLQLSNKTIPNQLKPIDYKINTLFFKSTLESLLNSCYSISILNLPSLENWELKKKQLNNQSFGSSDILINPLLKETIDEPLSIEELDNIKLQFKNLNLPLSIIIKNINFNNNNNNNINNENEKIKLLISKLFKMIIPYSVEKQSIRNYLYYCIMFKSSGSGNNENYEWFRYLVGFDARKFLFENCNGRKDLQIKYLDYFLDGGNISFRIMIDLFDLLVSLNDIILIEMVGNLLKDKIRRSSTTTSNATLPHQTFVFPKSTQVIDYLLSPNNLELKPIIKFKIDCLFTKREQGEDNGDGDGDDELRNNNNNYQLLYHYKNNYPINYFADLGNVYIFYQIRICSNETIDFILDNDNIKDFLKETDLVTLFKSKYYLHGSIEKISYLFNEIRRMKSKTTHLVQDPSQIINAPLLLYYYHQGLHIADKDIILNDSLIFEIAVRSDFKLFERILSLSHCSRVITRILSYSISLGKLEMFEYIVNSEKHKNILLNEITPTSKILTIYDINYLIDKAYTCFQPKFIIYFKEVLNFRIINN